MGFPALWDMKTNNVGMKFQGPFSCQTYIRNKFVCTLLMSKHQQIYFSHLCVSFTSIISILQVSYIHLKTYSTLRFWVTFILTPSKSKFQITSYIFTTIFSWTATIRISLRTTALLIVIPDSFTTSALLAMPSWSVLFSSLSWFEVSFPLYITRRLCAF